MLKKLRELNNTTAIFIITGLILLAFLPYYAYSGFIGDFGDPIGQTIPNKFLLIKYIENGIAPLWNSFSFLGMPFLADMQVGTFYIPDILIFSLFSPFIAHNISVLFHIILLAIGTYFFTNSISKSKLISIALGLTFSLSAVTLSKVVFLNFLEVFAYIPWVLFLINQKSIKISILALVLSLMIFAGHPVALFYSFIIILTFFLVHSHKNYRNIYFAASLALLVTAIQWIPFLALKAASVRDTLSYSQFTQGSLGFYDLYNLINPFAYNSNLAFDTFIYFGTVAAACVFISIFFIRKLDKKLYITGLVLFLLGILLSLGGTLSFLAELQFKIPVFNLIRVPARYIILTHIGALFCLIAFFKHLFQEKKLLASILLALISLNALATPAFFLTRHEIEDAKPHYSPEIKEFNILSIPEYYLSSSLVIFPNRHYLQSMHFVTGYNPMILKIYNYAFHFDPVGAFKNPDYLTDYYEKFEKLGVKYYLFPSQEVLEEMGYENKSETTNILKDYGWDLSKLEDETEIWENPDPTPFAYFLKSKNKITDISFQPGTIKATLDLQEDDLLVLNQTFTKDWKIETDLTKEYTQARVYKSLLQSYPIKEGTTKVEIKYKPDFLPYALFLSFAGLATLITQLIKRK